MENFKVWGRVKERILFLLLIIDIMVTTVSIKVTPITIHEPTGRLNIKFKPTPATAETEPRKEEIKLFFHVFLRVREPRI